jgi:hypothetical protein
VGFDVGPVVGEVPKNIASLRAVSAVMARRPFDGVVSSVKNFQGFERV